MDYKNILLLAYYRNQLMHVFFHEGIVCCALNAFGHQISFKVFNINMYQDGTTIERLWEETDFLMRLLKREFVLKRRVDTKPQFKELLDYMIDKNVLQVNGNTVPQSYISQ